MNSILKLVICFALFVLQSCEVPALYLINALESKDDVSADPIRGVLCGNEYELIEDSCYLKYRDSPGYYLSHIMLQCSVYRKIDGVEQKIPLIETQMVSFSKIIQKGTIIKINSVFGKKEFGAYDYQSICIYGPFADSEGVSCYADVTELFKRFSFRGSSEDSWNLPENEKFLRKINKE